MKFRVVFFLYDLPTDEQQPAAEVHGIKNYH